MRYRCALHFSLILPAAAVALVACGSTDKDASESVAPVKNEVPIVATAQVEVRELSRNTDIAGELRSYEDVDLVPKVDGFIQSITVDRGSRVKEGQVLITINAPEIEAKVAEAKAKVNQAKSAVVSAQSRLAHAKASVAEAKANAEGAEITFNRLKKAGKIPGAIADNEIDQAEKKASATREHVSALKEEVQAAISDVEAAKSELSALEQSFKATEDIRRYLVVRAPFDGVITERNVHPGDLVRPSDDEAMLKCENVSKLRLVVPVPEIAASGLRVGALTKFTVPAHPGKTFVGTVSRIGHSLDVRTRTMPVELDVANSDGMLEPGMYPTVQWQVQRKYETAFVPQSAVGHSLSKTYVDVVREGKIEVVPVKTGQTMDDFIEVFGDLHAGEQVAKRASEDLKPGTVVETKTVNPVQALSQ